MAVAYAVGFVMAFIIGCFLAFVLPVTLPLVLFVFWRIFQFRHRKKLEPFLVPWLNRVSGLDEVIAAEDEYQLSFGDTRPYRRTGQVTAVDDLEQSWEPRLAMKAVGDEITPGHLVACPFCGVDVVVMASGLCPSCRRVVA